MPPEEIPDGVQLKSEAWGAGGGPIVAGATLTEGGEIGEGTLLVLIEIPFKMCASQTARETEEDKK